MKRLAALGLIFAASVAYAQPPIAAYKGWKPPVANLAALPASGNTTGDTRIALDTFVHYTWDGDSWETAASGGGGVSDGDKGDITVASSGTVWTIDAGAVSADELDEAGVEAGLEAVLDLSDLQGAVTDAQVPDTVTIDLAATATALAANPADCAANQFANTIAASGALSCAAIADADVPNTITIDLATAASDLTCTNCIGGTEIDESALAAVPTATALAANGGNCTAGNYPLGVDASGAVESCTADDDVPESGDFGAAGDLEADGTVSADSVALTTDTTGNYVSSATANQGLLLTGTEGASLGLIDCAATEVLKRNAGDTAWECAADATGSGIGGSTGATDDRILISDGTGGATLAASGFSIDSNGTGKLVTSGSGTKVHVALGSVDVGIGTHATTNSGNLHILEADLGNWAGINAFDFYIANTGMNIIESFSGMGLRSDGGIIVLNENSSDMRHIRASILVEANTAGSGAPNVITQYESLTTFTNEGTTAQNYHTLPTAVAGYQFTFVVQDADGLRITSGASDTIRLLDKVTAAAGYIESTTIGSAVTLVSANAVEWFATSVHGVWTDGTFTYDDTGNTAP